MGRNRKYELDLTTLQYKLVRLPWKAKILRLFVWFLVSVMISCFYWYMFEELFGSPKEKMLTKQVENMKLQFELMSRHLDDAEARLNSLRLSDDKRYRPILEMDSVPQSFRKGGYGGVDRFSDLKNYRNAGLLISFRSRVEELKNMSNIQSESFIILDEKAREWKRQVDHWPGISPVSVEFQLGDKYAFRTIHPVLGVPRMHNGQDFKVPYGTNVYATGDGIVVESGFSTGGFGNYIVIDHDYGLQTLYGHLSEIRVPKGTNVKRGDLIGKSGDTGQSTGPHLHYQVEEKGKAINPLNWLNNDMTLEEYNDMIHAFGARSTLR